MLTLALANRRCNKKQKSRQKIQMTIVAPAHNKMALPYRV